jgi:hypothetical protein
MAVSSGSGKRTAGGERTRFRVIVPFVNDLLYQNTEEHDFHGKVQVRIFVVEEGEKSEYLHLPGVRVASAQACNLEERNSKGCRGRI